MLIKIVHSIKIKLHKTQKSKDKRNKQAASIVKKSMRKKSIYSKSRLKKLTFLNAIIGAATCT